MWFFEGEKYNLDPLKSLSANLSGSASCILYPTFDIFPSCLILSLALYRTNVRKCSLLLSSRSHLSEQMSLRVHPD